MKTLCAILLIAVADALLVLAALLLVSGYWWQAALLGVATAAGVALAAWLSRSRPTPQPVALCGVVGCTLPHWICSDPVDDHAAQMIRALTGKTAVLPEVGLLMPTKPRAGRHRLGDR